MKKEIEYYLKSIVRNHHCKKCLERLFKKYPNSYGCIFKYNNDEHLCSYAHRYYKDFDIDD